MKHRAPSKRAAIAVIVAALTVLSVGALSFAVPSATAVGGLSPLELAQTQRANCQLLLAHATSSAQATRARQCIADQTAIINALTATPSPSGSPSSTPPGPTATPTPSPTTSPVPTGSTPVPTTAPPTLTPTPTPTGPSGWPTPDSTGWRHTGVTLTVVTATIYAGAGQVIDSVEARGGIVVTGNGVTIRRSWVQGQGSGEGAGIWIRAGVTGTLIEDVEVSSHPGADVTNESAIVDRAVTGFNTRGTVMRRVYAHGVIRGLQFGCDTTITDSYVDGEVNPGGNHMSAVGGETCVGQFALTVRHNHIGLSPNPSDSAALLYYPPQVGPTGDQNAAISIVDNEILGGTYCMWLSSDPGLHGTLVVTGNRFRIGYYPTCGLYGPLFSDALPSQGGMVITWADNLLGTTPVAVPHG